jgi:hypothetical protein
MSLETSVAVKQWAPSYRRATWLQAPLALLGFAAGLVAWLLGASIVWLVAALLIGAVVPFTFIAVMRTNNKLLAPDLDLASPQTRALLENWGKLHAVRTSLSLVATVLCIWLLVRA